MDTITSSKTMECRRLDDGKFTTVKTGVVIEQELPIFLNGERLATASIAPGMAKEFVTGYLFGQGFIKSVDDIGTMDIENGGAKITLKNRPKASIAKDYRIVSGGGRTAYSAGSSLTKIQSGVAIPKVNIFRAIATLFQSAGIYGETEGVHAAGLFSPSASALCLVEDIGRHNSLDKVIGYALLNKIDCSETFIISTGRMASEMVTKICRAGIPVAATKTAVTDRGLAIARECGMTLIGFVRDKGTKINTDMDVRIIKEAGMKIYTGAERIIC